MNKKIKVVAFVMAIMMMISSAAFAMTGTVKGGSLKMRDMPSTDGDNLGWMKNGSTVTVSECGTTGWYAATGDVYGNVKCKGTPTRLSGYCMSKWIE